MSEILPEPTPLHTLNPLSRFSDRVDDYAKYRPSYPTTAIHQILAGLPQSIVVADIGAGTGISSRLLAEPGVKVIAIEPNPEMRSAAIPSPGVEYRHGMAESTNLPSKSVDLVTCFQAFHWFEANLSLAEFHRILKPGGRLAVVWNNRDKEDRVTAEYSRLVSTASQNHPAESRMKRIDPLFTSPYFLNVSEYTFTYIQQLDLHGLIGRALSASYVPLTGEANTKLIAGLEELYQRESDEHGLVAMVYRTSVHLAQAIQ